MKKKVGIIILIIILLAGAGAAVWYFKFREGAGLSTSSEDAVFVDSVATITGIGGNGTSNRFAGVVEPQRTVGVEVASGMKVKDTFVTVGQEVDVGTRLFSYDTDEAQNSITQLEIDIENYDIDIESTQAQIAQYEKERANVTEDSEKRAYTTSIMTAQNSIRRAEYNKKSKQAELERMKERIANSEVTSELKGVVKSINQNNSGRDDVTDSGYGSYDTGSDENANAYVVIMATGEYRIKGNINEQNMSQIYTGMSVIVHSRVDESVTWSGVVTTIDMENAQQNQNNSYYMGGSDSMTSSSSYPFYVDMEDSSGLMLGQHVYVEPDNGQGEVREGMWLDEYYLVTDENGEYTPYVWAASDSDRLELREVTLGEYDADMMQYQILDGLTADDYIALPSEEYQAGMPVTRNIDQAGDMYSDEEDLDDGGYYEEGLDDGGYYEEGLDDGGYYEEGIDFGDEYYDDGEFIDEGMILEE